MARDPSRSAALVINSSASPGTSPSRSWGPGRYEVRGGPRPSGVGGAYTRFKRLIIGEPLATAAAGHERLTKIKALAVLSSDALSSVAYATEEIMRVLLLAGTAALSASLGIGAVLVVLLFVVGFSYRQTIKAYPDGRRELHRRQGQPGHAGGSDLQPDRC